MGQRTDDGAAMRNGLWRSRLLTIWKSVRARTRSTDPFALDWSASTLVSPVIRHGPDGSDITFVLSSINDEAFAALENARRNRTPVRVRSLRRPLYLEIRDLERLHNDVRIAGRVACRTTPAG